MRNQVGAVSFEGSFAEQWPDIGLPEIAFAGRSNVGKSSALNRLLNSKKVARVSGTPGRTQRINMFRVGEACVFADLPGYGFARVPPAVQAEWKGMIERYLTLRESLRLVVVLVDSRRHPQERDGQMLWALTEARIDALVVATKIDKLKKKERRSNLEAIRQEFKLARQQPVPFSSVTGEGRSIVWDHIERVCRSGRR